MKSKTNNLGSGSLYVPPPLFFFPFLSAQLAFSPFGFFTVTVVEHAHTWYRSASEPTFVLVSRRLYDR